MNTFHQFLLNNPILANKLKDTQVNILITGATGCGKSSTINALFGDNVAKVGQTSRPQTMDISKYELDGGKIVLWDSPGLGDGKDADERHAKNIINKLYELDKNNKPLIDIVLVILDGSSRDLGTTFELINQVIIPNLGNDKKRLIVAINQADMAMKGRNWNNKENKPEKELEAFLNEKVISTKERIKEETQVDVNPIYYAAGYKDGSDSQLPYNMLKLLTLILENISSEKRIIVAGNTNKSGGVWKSNDSLLDYGKKALSLVTDAISAIVGGAVSIVSSVVRWVGSWF